MVKFEYMTVEYSASNVDSLACDLNQWGQDGWEVVADLGYHQSVDACVLLLKRPIGES